MESKHQRVTHNVQQGPIERVTLDYSLFNGDKHPEFEGKTPNENLAINKSKWTAKVSLSLAAPIEKLWEIGSEFLRVREWVPTMYDCKLVEGESNKPGCVRRCKFHGPQGEFHFADEKLIDLKPEELMYRYTLLENTLGFVDYVAAWKLSPGEHGTVTADWSMEMNPIPGKEEVETKAFVTGMFVKCLKALERLALTETQVPKI